MAQRGSTLLGTMQCHWRFGQLCPTYARVGQVHPISNLDFNFEIQLFQSLIIDINASKRQKKTLYNRFCRFSRFSCKAILTRANNITVMAQKESNALGDAEDDGNDYSDDGVDDKDDNDDDDLRGGGGG